MVTRIRRWDNLPGRGKGRGDGLVQLTAARPPSSPPTRLPQVDRGFEGQSTVSASTVFSLLSRVLPRPTRWVPRPPPAPTQPPSPREPTDTSRGTWTRRTGRSRGEDTAPRCAAPRDGRTDGIIHQKASLVRVSGLGVGVGVAGSARGSTLASPPPSLIVAPLRVEASRAGPS